MIVGQDVNAKFNFLFMSLRRQVYVVSLDCIQPMETLTSTFVTWR